MGQQFSTYLGWLIPWGTPITLIGDSTEQVADAQRQLVLLAGDLRRPRRCGVRYRTGGATAVKIGLATG